MTNPEPILRIHASPHDEIDEQELRSVLGGFMRVVNDREEPPGVRETLSAALTIIARAVQRINCPGCRRLQIASLQQDLVDLAVFVEGGTDTEHVH